MVYAFESARQQWEEAEQRLMALPRPERAGYQRAVDAVLDELRRRLGSRFTVQELSELYGRGVDWASALAWRSGAPTDAATAVDVAFARYAREAANYAGGRIR